MKDTANAVRPHLEQVARALLTPRVPQQRQALVLDGGETLRVATPEGVEGLGHRRLLSEPAVVAAAIAFITTIA